MAKRSSLLPENVFLEKYFEIIFTHCYCDKLKHFKKLRFDKLSKFKMILTFQTFFEKVQGAYSQHFMFSLTYVNLTTVM